MVPKKWGRLKEIFKLAIKTGGVRPEGLIIPGWLVGSLVCFVILRDTNFSLIVILIFAFGVGLIIGNPDNVVSPEVEDGNRQNALMWGILGWMVMWLLVSIVIQVISQSWSIFVLLFAGKLFGLAVVRWSGYRIRIKAI